MLFSRPMKNTEDMTSEALASSSPTVRLTPGMLSEWPRTSQVTFRLSSSKVCPVSFIFLQPFLRSVSPVLSLSLRNGSLCKHVPRPSGRPSSAGSGTGPHLHPAPKMAGQVIDSNNSQSDVQLSVMANQVVLLFNGTKEFLALEMHCFYNNLEFEISFVCDNVYESMNECHFFLDVNIFCRRIFSIKEILWCQKHDVVIDFLLSCRLFRCVFARRSFSWDVCDNHHDKEPKVHMERNCSPSFVREIGTKYYGSEFIS